MMHMCACCCFHLCGFLHIHFTCLFFECFTIIIYWVIIQYSNCTTILYFLISHHSEIYHSYKRKKYHILVLWEHLIIFHATSTWCKMCMQTIDGIWIKMPNRIILKGIKIQNWIYPKLVKGLSCYVWLRWKREMIEKGKEKIGVFHWLADVREIDGMENGWVIVHPCQQNIIFPRDRTRNLCLGVAEVKLLY